MKKISIISGCYNEEGNLEEFYDRIKKILIKYSDLDHEIIITDNASTDNSENILKKLAKKDNKLKIIINNRNLGLVANTTRAFNSATGNAVITIASDLEDPPELIDQFIIKWLEGKKIILGIREKSNEVSYMKILRSVFYFLMQKTSNIKQIKNFTGFGLYDEKFVKEFIKLNDPYPYFRGLIEDIGIPYDTIKFNKVQRAKGESKGNFFNYYDLAILGIVNYSNVFLRSLTLIGFLLSFFSFGIAIYYIIQKLLNWYDFQAGFAPIIILTSFFFGVLFIYLGLLAEQILYLKKFITRRPIVTEKERINFD
jgi:glycosyltransferase involved in cell wall biosynthesis